MVSLCQLLADYTAHTTWHTPWRGMGGMVRSYFVIKTSCHLVGNPGGGCLAWCTSFLPLRLFLREM